MCYLSIHLLLKAQQRRKEQVTDNSLIWILMERALCLVIEVLLFICWKVEDGRPEVEALSTGYD